MWLQRFLFTPLLNRHAIFFRGKGYLCLKFYIDLVDSANILPKQRLKYLTVFGHGFMEITKYTALPCWITFCHRLSLLPHLLICWQILTIRWCNIMVPHISREKWFIRGWSDNQFPYKLTHEMCQCHCLELQHVVDLWGQWCCTSVHARHFPSCLLDDHGNWTLV